jgi:hypothetical protein
MSPFLALRAPLRVVSVHTGEGGPPHAENNLKTTLAR